MPMMYLDLLLIFLAEFIPFAPPQRSFPETEINITIDAVPISAFDTDNPSLRRFGSLDFRGGLVLTSSNTFFGSISALQVQPDGQHFIALSDRAIWIRGRILYKDDRPVGIADATLAPMLDSKGKRAPGWDTESIAEDGDTVYVGLERIHSIMRFDFGKDGVRASGIPVPVPPEIKDLPSNQSLESLVFIPAKFRLKNTLIAISERGLTEDGNIKAFLVGGSTPGMFSVKRTEGYDISDAALLPTGDLLILERQYSLERGVAMRIRQIRQDDIKPGAVVDGTVIMEADGNHEIDNMEALSVHTSGSGEIILTLLSDNNFSSLQRTVFLQFALRKE